MNSRPTIILALVVSLYVLGIPAQAIALGTPTAHPSTKQPLLAKVSLFLHIVNTNSGLSVTGASVWFDDVLAGNSDQSGIVSISGTDPYSSHYYVVSAIGYRNQTGTITIGSNNNQQFTIRLAPASY
ncbi:MAG TPA: hypothetical protein VJZ75_04465 [Candidatus Bathyarchaeia archaeon]|nr:hypothetical protein [Candidatus Bathyarchaeia archaeon]